MLRTVCSLFPFRPLMLFFAAMSIGQAQEALPPPIPTSSYSIDLQRLSKVDDFKLYGIRNTQELEFTLRQDQVVTNAALNLAFTPSPALITKLSHLRAYLNDELVGVVPVQEMQPGQLQKHSLNLDTRFMKTFNRVRLEFVGHYADICEDLAHSSLWLDISKQTNIVINQQSLALANELSLFPERLLDMGDMQKQELPFVVAGSPATRQLRSASVLASYFGVKARWRKISFPVSYDTLPDGHAIVFAPNDARPGFLLGYPKVDGPTVDMISAPDNPYQKLLLIMGRNDDDIDTAVSALALGGRLFRGQSVRINEVQQVSARRPYDAPNWIPTDRPVLLSELTEYAHQLEVTGLRPPPITLNLNLPPDLFVWRNDGIPMQIRYRHTAPKSSDDSRLTLSLNGRFVDSYPLESESQKSSLANMRISVLGNDPGGAAESLQIPALKIGARNQIRFDFAYGSTLGSSQRDSCRT